MEQTEFQKQLIKFTKEKLRTKITEELVGLPINEVTKENITESVAESLVMFEEDE